METFNVFQIQTIFLLCPLAIVVTINLKHIALVFSLSTIVDLGIVSLFVLSTPIQLLVRKVVSVIFDSGDSCVVLNVSVIFLTLSMKDRVLSLINKAK